MIKSSKKDKEYGMLCWLKAGRLLAIKIKD